MLASPAAAPAERARAALFLSVDPCRDPVQPPAEARLWNDCRLRALEAIDFAAAGALPAALGGRVRLRHAEALAWRAFDEARQAHADAASRAEAAAVRELALCDRGVLAPEDLDLYDETAVRVAASRWATESPPKEKESRARKTVVSFAPRAPGETCVRLSDGAGDKAPLLGERCTFGVVWPSALRWAPSGDRRHAGRPAARFLDRALGPAPRRRRQLGLRHPHRRRDRSRRRLRRVGRVLARRRPPAGRP